jgi:hypothetical protein
MKKILINISILVCFVVVISCAGNQMNTVVPAKITADVGFCSLADKHLSDMCNADRAGNTYCCAVDALTATGKNFTEACEDIELNGVINLNAQCLSKVASCGDIDACTGSNK